MSLESPAPLTPLQRLLRTNLVWRLSGLSFATGVIATQGTRLDKKEYISRCARNVRPFVQLVDSHANVLEFGCGLGGNLIALSPHIGRGVGIDINGLYLWHARRLARSERAANLEFRRYDGCLLPTWEESFDVVLSVGVFERISKADVRNYIASLAKFTRRGGRLVLYFLSRRAMDSEFVRRLGQSSYEYWSRGEAEQCVNDAGLTIQSILTWEVADVIIADRQR